jgi:hypothetical protein
VAKSLTTQHTAARGLMTASPAPLNGTTVSVPPSSGLNPLAEQAIKARRDDIVAKIDSLLPGSGSAPAGKSSTIQMPKLAWVDVPSPGATTTPATTQASTGDVYWVSFARSDTPKAYELYSAYKTKAEADKAAQDIRNWAARTGWRVADIQIEKDPGTPPPAAPKGGQNGQRLTFDEQAPKGANLSKGNSWLANAYNPPANLPPPPTFATPSALPSAAPPAPTAAATTAAPAAARGPSWAAQRWQQLENNIAQLKRNGVLRTVMDEIAYRRDGLKEIGRTAARYNELMGQVKCFVATVENVLGMAAGEFKEAPHPALQGARQMGKSGIETQERNLVPNDDGWFNGVLHRFIQALKDALTSPRSLAEDRAKKGLEQLMTP